MAQPERGTCFRLQVYERVGITLVEVNIGKGREICHFREPRDQKGLTERFYHRYEKVEKISRLCRELFIFKRQCIYSG